MNKIIHKLIEKKYKSNYEVIARIGLQEWHKEFGTSVDQTHTAIGRLC